MRSWFRLASLIAPLALAGCSDSYFAGPLAYVENERLGTELKDKPKLQQKVRTALKENFGDDPQHIRVPEGAPLLQGGICLANYQQAGGGESSSTRPIVVRRTDPSGQPLVESQEGGYALYRKHCLHCHGVSGAGDGPTAPFLYPRPRDYRKGLFKFTSTLPTGAKPTREDLRKTIKYGLHGTSMPAFEALMNDYETEQVVDYVIFLSLRGEVENTLIEEAITADEADDESLSKEVVADLLKSVIKKWRDAEGQVLKPASPRVASTRESILRGRELFLGLNKGGNKVDCTSCHGPQALGNGPSFIDQAVFNNVVFGGDPSTMPERVAGLDQKLREQWKNSLDDWGNPLRPANLNRGVYKGGRRPIDLYWRIAKGINGAKMPAHAQVIESDRIWDLVNFVLALPYEPRLLEGATLPTSAPAPAPAVARR